MTDAVANFFDLNGSPSPWSSRTWLCGQVVTPGRYFALYARPTLKHREMRLWLECQDCNDRRRGLIRSKHECEECGHVTERVRRRDPPKRFGPSRSDLASIRDGLTADLLRPMRCGDSVLVVKDKDGRALFGFDPAPLDQPRNDPPMAADRRRR